VKSAEEIMNILEAYDLTLLTDNEKTVTVEHVAGVPVRNALTVTKPTLTWRHHVAMMR
jgi:hypothetical protein